VRRRRRDAELARKEQTIVELRDELARLRRAFTELLDYTLEHVDQ
jgi:hypothetical protein